MEEEFEVYSLDVWGNEEDGYDVNDRFKVGKIMLGNDWNKDRIFRALKDSLYLSKKVRRAQVTIDDSDENMIYIEDARSGRPVFQLSRVVRPIYW